MKVLLAEDEAVSRRVLEAYLLRWGYDIEVAQDGVQAWRILQRPDSPRLALLDWMMPEMDGVEVCQHLRLRQWPYVYVLLLSAKAERKDLLEALAAGADDYLTKPFDPDELRARLTSGQRIVELQDQLLAAREDLRFQATHDTLTGICNRGEILDIFHRELHRSYRHQSHIGVMMIDLDQFKRVNDSHGHMAGDAVLQEVTRRISRAIRVYDSVGRYGGEEFLVVTPANDALGLYALAERIRSEVESTAISTKVGMIRLTISIGAVACNGVGTADGRDLLALADAALYTAKEKGRNRVELAPATGTAGPPHLLESREIGPSPAASSPGRP